MVKHRYALYPGRSVQYSCALTICIIFLSLKINSAAPRTLTTSEVVQQVKQQFSGKIVSTRYQKTTHQYVVDILQRDGKVHCLRFDASTGEQIETDKNQQPEKFHQSISH